MSLGSVWAGAVAVRGTASSEAVTGKPKPRLKPRQVTKHQLSPARGLPARPRCPPKLREEALRVVKMLSPPPAPDVAL